MHRIHEYLGIVNDYLSSKQTVSSHLPSKFTLISPEFAAHTVRASPHSFAVRTTPAPLAHSPSTVLVRVLGRRRHNTACARGRPNLRSPTDIPPSPSVLSAPVVPALRGWSRHQSRSSKPQPPPVRHNARHPAPYPAPPAPLVPPSLTPTPSRCATVTAPPPHVSRNLA